MSDKVQRRTEDVINRAYAMKGVITALIADLKNKPNRESGQDVIDQFDEAMDRYWEAKK
jgi:hypothetical protein